jgi:hypothetical protein
MTVADMNCGRAGLADQRRPLERALPAADDQATLAPQRREIDQVAGVRKPPRRDAAGKLRGQALEVFEPTARTTFLAVMTLSSSVSA